MKTVGDLQIYLNRLHDWEVLNLNISDIIKNEMNKSDGRVKVVKVPAARDKDVWGLQR